MHDYSHSKILIVRTDRLGDVILSTPVAAALKKQFPQSQIHFLVRHYTRPIAEMAASVDEIAALDSFLKNGTLQFGRFVRFLKQQKFDVAIHLHPRPELAFATFFADIPVRIGTGYRLYSLLFNRRQYDHRKSAAFHEAEFNLRLLQQLGVPDSKVQFDMSPPASADYELHQILGQFGIEAQQPIAVLHPGSGGSARDWPLHSFAELADKLAQNSHCTVILTGGEHEKELVERVKKATASKPVSLAGRLSINTLASLLRRAYVFVGNSTGPLHLAVAMGAQVVAFYPPITPCRPERWGPYGRLSDVLMSQQNECTRCDRNPLPGECACMQAIGVEQAFAKVIEKLG